MERLISATGYLQGQPYDFQAVQLDSRNFLRIDAAKAYQSMEAAAEKDGVMLVLNSSFRSHSKQEELYRRYKNGSGNLAARPGYSHHQSGIAIDIESGGGKNAAYRWMSHNAHTYGFIRTVRSEPWHWEFHPERAAQQFRSGTLMARAD